MDRTRFKDVLVPGSVVAVIVFAFWWVANGLLSGGLIPPGVLLLLALFLVIGSVVGLVFLARSDRKRRQDVRQASEEQPAHYQR